MKSSSVFFLFICFFNNLAFAQNDSSSSVFQVQSLNEIVIQENRISSSFSRQNRNITVLDQEVIQSLPVHSVNELLTYVAGIDVRQRGPNGTQADIGIDGGTFDQTLVLINGIKVSDPQTGHNMMNIPISLNAIDRVEVLKGATARIYGINALNGAINIITKQPKENEVAVHLFSGSSFERDTSSQKLYGNWGIETAASLSGKNSDHFISLSHTQSSGYRYNTSYQNEKAFYQNKIKLGKDNSLSFMGGFVYNEFGANGFYSSPGDIESKETVQTGIAGLSGVFPIQSFWTFKPRISYRYNHDDYIFIREKPEVYRNKHETNVINVELNNSFTTGVGSFGLGLEIRNEKINSNSLGKWDRNNLGIFAEYRFDQVKDLLINIGSYANYNSDFGWQVLPGIDLGYRFYNNFRAFANAGTGQRLPTYTDLYYKGPSNIGNDQLKPEQSFHTELGLKYNSNQLNASASYFFRNTSDFIDWVKDSISQPWQPLNFQEIQTNGFTFSADYRFQPANSEASLNVLSGISYTWLSPKIVQSESSKKLSQYALENLKHQLTGRIQFTYLKKINFSLAARYQQRINQEDYTLLDSRIGVLTKNLEFYTDISNLTNRTITNVAAVPMMGRWVSLGIIWKYR